MEFFESFLGYFLVFVVIAVAAFFISRLFGQKKIRGFQGYLAQNFPELAPDMEMLAAKQKSKGMRMDIALVINKSKEELIVLLDNKGEGMRHVTYSFSDLESANVTDTVISRGALPKQYSYERTIPLVFKDGSTYKIIQEFPSNKHGNDKGADIVRDIFAPWEKSLKEILA